MKDRGKKVKAPKRGKPLKSKNAPKPPTIEQYQYWIVCCYGEYGMVNFRFEYENEEGADEFLLDSLDLGCKSIKGLFTSYPLEVDE
jgi:hypothetical protein